MTVVYLFYNAMLQAGRALMFSKGYRPKGKYQHAVVEFVRSTFSEEFADNIVYLQQNKEEKTCSML